MELSLTAAVLLGLLMAGWTIAAAVLMLSARAKVEAARSSRNAGRRLGRMIEQSPAIPMLVKSDGSIEGSERLAAWLGLESLPGFLSELTAPDGGLLQTDLDRLREAVRHTQKTAAPFRMELTPRGARRSLALRGQHADPAIAQGGAALVWWFDFSEYQDDVDQLSGELAAVRGDFAALAGVIEAAPIAMWFRGPDFKLRLVNRAYADAVGVDDENDAVAAQIELIEPQYGRQPAMVAEDAQRRAAPVERTVTATVRGQRRAMRVCDIPMGEAGVAGFAVDVEDQEAQERALRAHDEARRAMLDLLSAAVAQFDYDRRLIFANKPFQRIFGLAGTEPYDGLGFNRFLDLAREKGRVPETSEYPAWRRDMGAWFERDAPVEEAWTLSDGAHLRIAGIPMPDGGLVLLAEDRTEHLSLAATRDTLLRTRAAIFDSLAEALVIFSPDGRAQLWNRSFLSLWHLTDDEMQTHPRADQLVEKFAPMLENFGQAAVIGAIVRSATLDREARQEEMTLANGSQVQVSGLPLPDGNGLLTIALPTIGMVEPVSLPEDPVPEARIEAAQITAEDLEPEDIAPFAFLTALVRDRETLIESRNLTFDLRGNARARSIRGDPGWLRTALGDLIDDAITDTPDGGRLELTLVRARNGAQISLRGDALDPEMPDRMQQARDIIAAHRGELSASTDPATGTTIAILLP